MFIIHTTSLRLEYMAKKTAIWYMEGANFAQTSCSFGLSQKIRKIQNEMGGTSRN